MFGRHRHPRHDDFLDPIPLPPIEPAQLTNIPEPQWRQIQEQRHHTTLNERKRIIELQGRIAGLQRSQLLGLVALGVTMCVAGLLYGSHLGRLTDKAAHAQELAATALAHSEKRHDALIAYQIASCERGNESRVIGNRSDLKTYTFDREVVELVHVLEREPTTPNPLLTSAQRRENAHLAGIFLRHLESTAAGLEWRYLVRNCHLAVADPAEFAVPPPVRFSVKMPPPMELGMSSRSNSVRTDSGRKP